MKLQVQASADLESHSTPLLAVPIVEDDGGARLPDLPGALGERVAERLHRADLRGGLGRSVVVATGLEGGPERVLLLGVGRPGGDADGSESTGDGSGGGDGGVTPWSPETVRRWAGHAVRAAEGLSLPSLSLWLDPLTAGGGAGAGPAGAGDARPATERVARAAAEGVALAAWRFRELLSGKGSGAAPEDVPPDVGSAALVVGARGTEAAERGARVGAAVARGENFARDLQWRPGNVATPTHLAEQATAMASEVGLRVSVLGPDRLREERMHALLAVARGSREEPRLITLEHRGGPDGQRPLVLVGKGLTFDAGGISIKPSKGMEDMKYDMSAGAAVLGAMRAVAELELPLNVVGIVPSSENLPGGSALKPGDVIQTRAGKTVEVINTDAEGRLILSDALDWALGFEPEAVVDCATLTGAVVIALGHHAAGVMGNDEAVVEELRRAGEESGERCWPLPLWDEYRRQLRSDVADLKNVGGRPAGTITAACFLSEFVGEARWGHLDVAGTAYGTEPLPYQRKGGYGFPTRLLVEWVRSRAG